MSIFKLVISKSSFHFFTEFCVILFKLRVITDLLPVATPVKPEVKLNSLFSSLFFNLQQLLNESALSDI